MKKITTEKATYQASLMVSCSHDAGVNIHTKSFLTKAARKLKSYYGETIKERKVVLSDVIQDGMKFGEYK